MSWISRLIHADDGTPPASWIAGVLGVTLGVSVFGGPAFLLGARHAGAGWLVAWAMLWSPPFCLGRDAPGPGGVPPTGRWLLALVGVALINLAVLFAAYLAGRLFLPG